MEWISVKNRLPNKKEQEKNWKFLVCNEKDKWTDAAYFDPNGEDGFFWNNGECEIIPTHWKYLPRPYKSKTPQPIKETRPRLYKIDTATPLPKI